MSKKSNTTITAEEEFIMKSELNRLLNETFKYDSLKPEQFEVIKNILLKKDVCGILPTGFGKSVCYQLPYLYNKKNVIIISPLIALMEDQVRQLNDLNIPVCCLNSNNNNKQEDLKEIFKGNPKIIYTTPEYLLLNNTLIERMCESDILSLVAIDESHCVSNWGHNFRPDYIKLNFIREIAPNIPLLALTATATKKIQNDICKNLKLDSPVIIKGDFDRPNLFLNVFQRDNNTFEDKIIPLISKYLGQKVLIYCKWKEEFLLIFFLLSNAISNLKDMV